MARARLIAAAPAAVLVASALLATAPWASSSARASLAAAASSETLVEQAQRLTDAESSGGEFGYSVALSADGSTALVGAPTAAGGGGEVLAFARSGAAWIQEGPAITAADLGVSASDACAEAGSSEPDECHLGRAVAISADGATALVGAPGTTGPCSAPGGECANQGAAFVLSRSGSTWSRAATLTGASEETSAGRFGRGVALSADGKTALVGASSDANGRGSAFVFTGAGSSWSQQGSKLTGGPAELGEGHLGGSVTLSGDGATALVGAPGDSSYLGAAWIFTRSGSSWSTPGAKLTAGREEGGVGHFGHSVALAGDGSTALIGARADSEDDGAAWAYARSGSNWTQIGPKLTAGPAASVPGEFGYSLALSADGSQALIGAPREHGFTGGAWLLRRSGSRFSPPGEPLEATGETGRSWLGASVALSADGASALVAGPIDNARSGAVWTFAMEAAPTPQLIAVSPAAGPEAGGTKVKITGAHLGAATSVDFGATPAAFTVSSPTSLTAISPPGKGTVDVTVTTPAGTTVIAPPDRFAYTPGATSPASGGPPMPPAATATATGAVAAFGPISSSPLSGCRLSLRSGRATMTRAGVVAVRLRAAGTCAGRLLTLNILRRSHGRARLTRIAARRFSLVSGRALALRVHIGPIGRALLRAAHGPVPVTVLVTNASASSARTRLGTLRLTR